MAANPPSNDLNFPHSPPPPTSDHHPTTVIVIFFISFGSLVFLGACLFGLWWFFRRSHKKKKLVHKTEDIDVDEHRKVQELVVPGRHGPKTVVLSVEDEVRVHDKVRKDEIDMVSNSQKGLHGAPKDDSSTSHQLNHPEERV